MSGRRSPTRELKPRAEAQERRAEALLSDCSFRLKNCSELDRRAEVPESGAKAQGWRAKGLGKAQDHRAEAK